MVGVRVGPPTPSCTPTRFAKPQVRASGSGGGFNFLPTQAHETQSKTASAVAGNSTHRQSPYQASLALRSSRARVDWFSEPQTKSRQVTAATLIRTTLPQTPIQRAHVQRRPNQVGREAMSGRCYDQPPRTARLAGPVQFWQPHPLDVEAEAGGAVVLFELEQRLFASQSAAVAGEGSVRADYSVAGGDDADRVVGVGVSDASRASSWSAISPNVFGSSRHRWRPDGG